MCCPTNKIIKSNATFFLALEALHQDTLCEILRAMAPTNVEAVHQTPFFHIESNPDRLGFSPTHCQRSQQQSGQITLQSVLISKSKFLKAAHPTKGKIEIPRSMVVEVAGARASIQPSKVLCIPEKAPRILPVRRSLSAFVGRKQTVVKDRFFS